MKGEQLPPTSLADLMPRRVEIERKSSYRVTRIDQEADHGPMTGRGGRPLRPAAQPAAQSSPARSSFPRTASAMTARSSSSPATRRLISNRSNASREWGRTRSRCTAMRFSKCLATRGRRSCRQRMRCRFRGRKRGRSYLIITRIAITCSQSALALDLAPLRPGWGARL